jgi:hypothetical protein
MRTKSALNFARVEMADTPEDHYIFVGQELYVTELTRQAPFQAEVAPEFMQEDYPASYNTFEVRHLVKMLQRLEKESTSWNFK